MSPPLLAIPRPLSIDVQPLTPTSFAPFGTAISCPHAPSSHSPIPPQPHLPTPIPANQSTALKYSPISPFRHTYPSASSPLMSLFLCTPRPLTPSGAFHLTILERHPFTTQTFSPLDLAADDPDTCFLIIVAPSLPGSVSATTTSGAEVQIQNPPDLAELRAFVANGGQAVTYGVGTWHAPMVVLGRTGRRVGFLVTQFVSGVAEEDCQEVVIGGAGVVVRVGGVVGRRERESKL